MKGIIFTYLEEFVIENYGIEALDDLLENTSLITEGGIFVAPGNYPDEDLMALVKAASEKTKTPVNDIVFLFGKFVLSKFHTDYSEFFEGISTTKELLLSIQDIIHDEVKKLYPDAILPDFEYEDKAPDTLVMIYKSPRGLCQLAKGLIAGAGIHFNETISINEPECIHNGAEKCRFELSFNDK